MRRRKRKKSTNKSKKKSRRKRKKDEKEEIRCGKGEEVKEPDTWWSDLGRIRLRH